ncbi:MAG: SET domain-containing protein-lysine N-methyltransferase [Nanoarchaeota archaeon]|nr:SET domain-containing protein-lysine N-methyltransferase [Nanoarchaeota archaeon]
MDNPKVEIRKTKLGTGLVAKESLKKDEIIAEFDGKIYEAKKCSDLPKAIANYAIQIGEHKWKDSKGFARVINHSCNPNIGYKDSEILVAMRDIKPGEELTLDYEMSEDSDWRMNCLCRNKNCRKVIGSFKNMSEKTREKYRGYISEWLRKKYNLK